MLCCEVFWEKSISLGMFSVKMVETQRNVCCFPYLDIVIFSPSKIKLVEVIRNFMYLTQSRIYRNFPLSYCSRLINESDFDIYGNRFVNFGIERVLKRLIWNSKIESLTFRFLLDFRAIIGHSRSTEFVRSIWICKIFYRYIQLIFRVNVFQTWWHAG